MVRVSLLVLRVACVLHSNIDTLWVRRSLSASDCRSGRLKNHHGITRVLPSRSVSRSPNPSSRLMGENRRAYVAHVVFQRGIRQNSRRFVRLRGGRLPCICQFAFFSRQIQSSVGKVYTFSQRIICALPYEDLTFHPV
jgi:hypothetical protein